MLCSMCVLQVFSNVPLLSLAEETEDAGGGVVVCVSVDVLRWCGGVVAFEACFSVTSPNDV